MSRPFTRILLASLLLAGAAAIFAFRHYASQTEELDPKDGYPASNYSCIEEGLWLGGMVSAPPGGTRAVLNVCETKDPYVAEVHHWEPIPDLGPAPSIEWLQSQVEFIDEQRKAGRPVYVHCRAGVNRSVMVVAAYLMWRDGLSRELALKLVRDQRPRAGPFEVYDRYLAEWEKTLKK